MFNIRKLEIAKEWRQFKRLDSRTEIDVIMVLFWWRFVFKYIPAHYTNKFESTMNAKS